MTILQKILISFYRLCWDFKKTATCEKETTNLEGTYRSRFPMVLHTTSVLGSSGTTPSRRSAMHVQLSIFWHGKRDSNNFEWLCRRSYNLFYLPTLSESMPLDKSVAELSISSNSFNWSPWYWWGPAKDRCKIRECAKPN